MSGKVFLGEAEVEEEEDDDFTSDPCGKVTSRLQSLFSKESSLQGNQSLVYTAPVAPNSKAGPSSCEQVLEEKRTEDGGSRVLFAAVVHAFFLKDANFSPVGKAGLALVASNDSKEFKLLLYSANKKPITTTRLDGDSGLRIQTDNYVTFLDLRRIQWSVSFTSPELLKSFAQWVMAIGAVREPGNMERLDVQAGEGKSTAAGDLLEIEYQEFLIEPGPQVTEVKLNPGEEKILKLKLGKGKAPNGWETGICGIRKGGTRFFLAPNPETGSGGVSLPNDFPLLVLVHLRRVKFSSKADSARQEEAQKDTDRSDSEEPPPVTIAEERKLSHESPNVPLEEPKEDSTKSNLVHRMARIGQAMFPVPELQKEPDSSSDSEVAQLPDFQDKPSQDTSQVPVKQVETKIPESSAAIPKPAPTPNIIPQMAPFYRPYGVLPMGSSGESQAGIVPILAPMFYPPPQFLPQTLDGSAKSEELMKKFQESVMETMSRNFQTLEDAISALNGKIEEIPRSERTPDTEGDLKLDRILDKLEALTSLEKPDIALPDSAHDEQMTELSRKFEALEGFLREEADRNSKEKSETEKEGEKKILALETRINSLQDELEASKAALKQPEEAKLKEIMSDFFRLVSSKFESGQSYEGAVVQKLLLSAVKESTISVIRGSADKKAEEDDVEKEREVVTGMETGDKQVVARASSADQIPSQSSE